MIAVPLGEFDALTGAAPEVVEFCPACFTASYRSNIDDVWGMNREYPFNAFVADYTPYSERLVGSSSAARNDGTAKYLDTGFVAFFDPALYLDNITYLKVRELFFEALAFNKIHNFSLHGYISCDRKIFFSRQTIALTYRESPSIAVFLS